MIRDKKYTIDIETSDLLQNMLDFSSFPYKLKKDAKLWCVVITDVETKESKKAVKEEITYEWMKESLKDCKYLIAHNGVKFDWKTLNLFGVFDYNIGYLNETDTLFGEEVVFVDTLILSRLGNPDRFGGHSLKAWGQRIGDNFKDDFRQQCIDAGIIEKGSPKGAEFRQWTPLMLDYCIKDTIVNVDIYAYLVEEFYGHDWKGSIKIEHKLADLAIRRESLGFWFDKDLALELVEDLTNKMQDLTDKVNPILPPKPMGKTELKSYIPPKTQVKKDGSLSSYMEKFIERTDGLATQVGEDWFVRYKGGLSFKVPFENAVKTTTKGTIDDLNHVKQTLIDDYNWIPSEWRERDLTKDSKKQNLPYKKRIEALERWYEETMGGKFKKLRLKELGIKPKDILPTLAKKLENDFPVRVPTSPPIRVGVEKELCPNLLKLGEEVEFAKDFALYLTYKHRKSCIAGGDIEDMDLTEEVPNTGYLSNYREEDGRISTPAIEIGAATNRYVHIGVANVPRTSSEYGSEMRSLFGCGEGFIQLGFDFSSLENRIQGHYVYRYPQGKELAEMLMAEKPNDLHSVNAKKLSISRSDAKSITYGILYGAQPKKISKMLSISIKEAEKIYNDFWDAVPALRDLKIKLEQFWESTNKKYILGLDGRKIMVRSKHSLLNFLFQSGGIISAKYTTVFLFHLLEKKGYCIDCFKGRPDIGEMISYHDEVQLAVNQGIIKLKTFESEEDAKNFISEYKGGYQLSSLKNEKKWYVALPSDVSIAIEDSIKYVEEYLKMDISLGIEYDVHKNWMGCH